MKVVGYTYEEIRILTGGRTFTKSASSLVKARGRIQRTRASVDSAAASHGG
jgi:hypothetical protein